MDEVLGTHRQVGYSPSCQKRTALLLLSGLLTFGAFVALLFGGYQFYRGRQEEADTY